MAHDEQLLHIVSVELLQPPDLNVFPAQLLHEWQTLSDVADAAVNSNCSPGIQTESDLQIVFEVGEHGVKIYEEALGHCMHVLHCRSFVGLGAVTWYCPFEHSVQGVQIVLFAPTQPPFAKLDEVQDEQLEQIRLEKGIGDVLSNWPKVQFV